MLNLAYEIIKFNVKNNKACNFVYRSNCSRRYTAV